MRLEKAISDVGAPWVLNVLFFLILGAGFNALGAGLSAAFLTGVVPRAVIEWLVRRGDVSHRHVTRREQRKPVFAAIVVCLAATVMVFAVLLPAPREMWIALGAAVGFIVLFALVTLIVKVKVSVHVGLWVTVWSYLAVVLSPWWAIGLVGVPAVAWSRVRLGHHTPREVVGGLVAGVIVLACALGVLGAK